MSIPYSVSDAICRVRNALNVKHLTTNVKYSRLVWNVLDVMVKEGWLEKIELLSTGEVQKEIKVFLKYDTEQVSVISDLNIKSKPSKREYVAKAEIPKVQSGFGTCILSTSKGILSGKSARLQNVGGELLLEVS